MHRFFILFIAFLSLIISTSAIAQSRQIPAAAQSGPIVIHSATVHTVSGETIENDGFIVFDNGIILHVGRGKPTVIAEAEYVDASGLHVYPGLISTDTYMGLTETSSIDVTNDHTEFGNIKPEVRAAVAVNPDSALIPVARANGILTAMVFPRGGLISGRGSTIRMDGWTWEDMTLDPEAGLLINWPRTEPSPPSRFSRTSESDQLKQIKKNLESIEDFFDDALAYAKSRDADTTLAKDLRFEAMRYVLKRRKPVYVRASSVGQIESAVAWAVRRRLKLVIVGGLDADKTIELLKKHHVPVIITGLHRLPGNRHDDYDRIYTLPLKLHEAGILFAIASGTSPAHERNLNHNAATAVAYGLPKIEALKSITLSAAQIIGLGSTHGSIEVNKSATLIITDGDPLQITTDTLIAFIDGRRIDLGSRHKTLNDKYREKYRQLGIIND